MRYRGLLTNIEAGVVVYYPDTSIKMHNTRAVELLGISESQMDGKPLTASLWNCLDSNSNQLSLEEYPVNRILKTKSPSRIIYMEPIIILPRKFYGYQSMGFLL